MVDDIFTWEITKSNDPKTIGLTKRIKIIEIDNTTDIWHIEYYLKNWIYNNYDGYLHLLDIGKDPMGSGKLSYFCPLPVIEYIQEYSSVRSYTYSDNTLIYDGYDSEQWTFDINTGILISYSYDETDGLTYTCKLKSSGLADISIPGYDLNLLLCIFGLISISITIGVIQFKLNKIRKI